MNKNKLKLLIMLAGSVGLIYTIFQTSKIFKIEDIFDIGNENDIDI